jgi:hypothetical protein
VDERLTGASRGRELAGGGHLQALDHGLRRERFLFLFFDGGVSSMSE